MADSISGAGQVLTVDGTTISGPDHGLSAVALNYAPATFETTSGGLTTSENAGPVVVSGSFSVNETRVTGPLLVGATGKRKPLVWNPGSGAITMTAILTVSHVCEDRGKRVFNVSFEVDGAPS